MNTIEFCRGNINQISIVAGVLRWLSNGQVPPQDCLEAFVSLGLVFSMVASQTARDADVAAFMVEYRRNHKGRKASAEERFEMRAAFGPGKTVVNVITGRRTRT